MQNLRGKKVLVMGLGRFGGGVGVTRFCAGQGAQVLVTDQLTQEQLSDSLESIKTLPIEYRLGEHDPEDFRQADIVVVNPAVDPHQNELLKIAQDAGAMLTSEIRLLTQYLPNRQRVIGITGTAGKSTTTAMVGHALSQIGQVWVGGNLGGSLLEHLEEIQPEDWVVLELSSFMLEGLHEDHWSPHIAAATNLSPNHLDRHHDLAQYIQAKQVIFDHQTTADWAVLPSSLLLTFNVHSQCLYPVTTESIALLLPGEHNQINAQMALTICQCAGMTLAEVGHALKTFVGLDHRLQFVCEQGGVRCFNDSKSTTPASAILAIKSFEPGTVHLILGGYDKKSDLTELAQQASKHCVAVYTIGETGGQIADCCMGLDEVYRCETLANALLKIRQQARSGEVVLLSPGCASWDQFDHFEQRGNAFVQAVRQWEQSSVDEGFL